MVYADRWLAVVVGLEAAIPDAAAVVFACLGVALALHGRRALRARAFNVASVGASVFMDVIAAAPDGGASRSGPCRQWLTRSPVTR